jgi:hypothetical protein
MHHDNYSCEKYTALKPSGKARKKAESPGPLMQNCSCKQGCPHPLYCVAVAHVENSNLLALKASCRSFRGTSPSASRKQQDEGCARMHFKIPSELLESKQTFSGQTQCEVGWCQPHTTLAAGLVAWPVVACSTPKTNVPPAMPKSLQCRYLHQNTTQKS